MENNLINKYGDQPRWISWKLETRNKKITKIPYQLNGRLASSTDPSTWSTYEEIKSKYTNVGIVLKEDSLLLCVDIDMVVNEKGEIDHEQKDIIKRFLIESNTYQELSQSKTGIHLFFALEEAFTPLKNKKTPYEIYSKGRYIATTGDYFQKIKKLRTISATEMDSLLEIIGYPWTPKEEIINKEDKAMVPVRITIPLDDQTLLKRMFKAKNGDKVKALYKGDISAFDNDDSRADMSLCSSLAFWTQKNAQQMERIWTNSPLGSREKTQDRQDYRIKTIAKAISNCTKVYEPKVSKKVEMNSDNDFKVQLQNCGDNREIKAVLYSVAMHLINKHHVKSIGGAKREMYVYQEGVYVEGLDILKMEIRKLLENMCTVFYSNEIIQTIKDLTTIDRESFKVDVNILNFSNGILDIRTQEFGPHNSKHLFFTKIPIDYNPTADCPVIKEFLSQVLDDQSILIIQEWFGYALYREYFIKKALICVGEGDTGKTTLFNLFNSFMGPKNVSGVSLQKISYDKFATAGLYNKYINLYDDLSFKDIQDNGSFKIVTGGGFMSAEKKFGDMFQFKNYAKLTFACNKIPDVKDSNDEAYFNRWIVIEFNMIVEEDKKDKQLTHKMSTSDELSGLLNFALEGLDRLLKNQSFSYEKDTSETKSAMMRSGSSIARFVFDSLEEAGGEWISKDDLYQAFINYAQKNKIPTSSMKTFGGRLPMCAPYIAEFKPMDSITNKQVTAWRNVKLKIIDAPVGPVEVSEDIEEVFKQFTS